MLRQFLHARLVTQDTTLGALRTGVDGQHGQLAAMLLQHVDAKLVDRGRLACARHTADTHTDRVAAIGQTAVNDLLRLRLMVRIDALDKGDGLAEDGDITFDDALDHLGHRQFTTAETRTLQVGIDDALLLYAAIHLQAGKFGTILWVFHIYNWKIYNLLFIVMTTFG